MKTIHRINFQLSPGILSVRTPLPEGATPISFQNQREVPTLWFECDPSKPKKMRQFIMMRTGDVFDPNDEWNAKYIGTAQFKNGEYVLHLYEQKDA